MSIDIRILLEPSQGDIRKQLDDHMSALGFRRHTGVSLSEETLRAFGENVVSTYDEDASMQMHAKLHDQTPGDYEPGDEVDTGLTEDVINGGPEPDDAKANDAAPKRERGKPSAGRQKRTSAEVAEDKAADELDAKNAAAQAEAIAQTKAAISTGEERISPEDASDVQEQDEADEQAETAADAGKPVTKETVRDVLGQYLQKFGIAAAQEDGMKVFKMVCGKDTTYTKISELPDDAALLGKIADGIAEMLAKNPFERASTAD